MICGYTLSAIILTISMLVIFLCIEYRRWKALTWYTYLCNDSVDYIFYGVRLFFYEFKIFYFYSLIGEVVVASAMNVLKFASLSNRKQGISGTLFVTNFKIAFLSPTSPSYPGSTKVNAPFPFTYCHHIIVVILNTDFDIFVLGREKQIHKSKWSLFGKYWPYLSS